MKMWFTEKIVHVSVRLYSIHDLRFIFVWLFCIPSLQYMQFHTIPGWIHIGSFITPPSDSMLFVYSIDTRWRRFHPSRVCVHIFYKNDKKNHVISLTIFWI